MLRIAKIALLFAVAVYYALVVLNNLTDYDSNCQFVRHVLTMDTTFPDNRGLWRALNSSSWHTVFYLTIILWEFMTMALCGWGALRLLNVRAADASEFQHAKQLAIAGLTLGMLMWLVAFLTVGGEWFLMWQSKIWNGQEAAFRMFTILGIILLLLAQPEGDERW